MFCDGRQSKLLICDLRISRRWKWQGGIVMNSTWWSIYCLFVASYFCNVCVCVYIRTVETLNSSTELSACCDSSQTKFYKSAFSTSHGSTARVINPYRKHCIWWQWLQSFQLENVVSALIFAVNLQTRTAADGASYAHGCGVTKFRDWKQCTRFEKRDPGRVCT